MLLFDCMVFILGQFDISMLKIESSRSQSAENFYQFSLKTMFLKNLNETCTSAGMTPQSILGYRPPDAKLPWGSVILKIRAGARYIKIAFTKQNLLYPLSSNAIILDPHSCFKLLISLILDCMPKSKEFLVYPFEILDVNAHPCHLKKFHIDYFMRVCFHSPVLGPDVSSSGPFLTRKHSFIFVERRF